MILIKCKKEDIVTTGIIIREADSKDMAETQYGIYYTEEISKGAFKIYEQRSAALYLVTGDERACLIDTAYGLTDLKALAAHFTALPVTVINTHGHIDHVLGNHWFDKAYLHPADRFMYDEITESFPDIIKDSGVQDLYGDFVKNINAGEIHFPVPDEIREGDVIDLGGKKLEIYDMPGHTPGSIVILDRDAKICYSGDSIIENLWLFLEESLEPEIYLKSLLHIRDILAGAGVENIFNGHFYYRPITMPELENMIEAMEKLTAGELEGVPVKNHAGEGIEYAYKGWKVICPEGSPRVPDQLNSL